MSKLWSVNFYYGGKENKNETYYILSDSFPTENTIENAIEEHGRLSKEKILESLKKKKDKDDPSYDDTQIRDICMNAIRERVFTDIKNFCSVKNEFKKAKDNRFWQRIDFGHDSSITIEEVIIYNQVTNG